MDDVLVVGAGPAGSAAALVLARAGARVRVVDRASFPRDKLCGDTVNPGALALLDGFGVGDGIRRAALATTGMIVTGPGGATVSADYPDGLLGAAIRRRDLDLLLIDAATRAGARFDPAVKVRAPLVVGDRLAGARAAGGGREFDIPARVVIAADGRHSTLATSLRLARRTRGPQRWAFGAYFVGVEGISGRGEMHLATDGYIGLAPLRDGVANVCVVRERQLARQALRDGPRQLMAAAIRAEPHLRDRFARAQQVTPVVTLGPLASEATGAGLPGLLLAGDAAGFIDPMTGDGLRFALRGGELAADAALRELATGEPAHRALASARRREFGRKFRVNRALRWLVGSPRALAMTAAASAYWRLPVAHLIAVAGDCGAVHARERWW